MQRILLPSFLRHFGGVNELNLSGKHPQYLKFSRTLAQHLSHRNTLEQSDAISDHRRKTLELYGFELTANPYFNKSNDKKPDGPRLSSSMTSELEEEIVGEKLGLKFMLKQALSEIVELETRKQKMPLPECLGVDQWRKLISLTDSRSRFYYLDSIMFDTISWDDILVMDETMCDTLEVSEDDIKEAVDDDKEARRKIDLFLMHLDMKKQDGEPVPWRLNKRNLLDISKINSMSGHHQYIKYLADLETIKIVDRIKKRNKQISSKPQINEREIKIENEKHLYYGLGHNTINIRISDSTMDQRNNWTAVREFNTFGTPLIIDVSYIEKHTINKNVLSMMYKEFVNVVSFNREAASPFALHFTDVSADANKIMSKAMLGMDSPEYPAMVTPDSHLDMFPRERLVYLSPDSRNDLPHFDEDDIYVIGGLIDTGEDRGPHTLAKAKKLGIRHARFPMRKMLGFTKELNVCTSVAILNDMKAHQDWFYSLRWVPSRLFGNRLKSGEPHIEHKLTYRAHKALSPVTSKGEPYVQRNRQLGPDQYRDMYKKIMDVKTMEEMNELLESLKI